MHTRRGARDNPRWRAARRRPRCGDPVLRVVVHLSCLARPLPLDTAKRSQLALLGVGHPRPTVRASAGFAGGGRLAIAAEHRDIDGDPVRMPMRIGVHRCVVRTQVAREIGSDDASRRPPQTVDRCLALSRLPRQRRSDDDPTKCARWRPRLAHPLNDCCDRPRGGVGLLRGDRRVLDRGRCGVTGGPDAPGAADSRAARHPQEPGRVVREPC